MNVKVPLNRMVLQQNKRMRVYEKLLNDYRNVRDGGEENRDKRMTCTVNLLHFYKDEIKRQEMYVRYIHKLAELHLESNNYTEAAFTLKLHAQLLDWTDRELEENKEFAAQKEWERKEELYLRIIAYFDTGKGWEYGISLCEELADFYKTKIMYRKLSNIRQFEATCYEKILNEMRHEAEYFRVGFYGQSFPLFLRNKEFIYRGQELERLSSFQQRIMAEHGDASMLNCNSALADTLRAESTKYIQISPVKPVSKVDDIYLQPEVPVTVQNFYRFNEVDTFQLDRPFHKGVKDDDNEFKTLCIERTTMKTISKLPGILRWFEVESKTQQILSPIEVAIDAVSKKTEQIRGITAEYMAEQPENIKPLTMLLNGTIDAAVQGGLRKYEEAFFSDEFLRDNPYHQQHVSQLKATFIDQIQILEQALHLHGELMTLDVKPLHQRLTELFYGMKKGIKDSGSPSLARLMSVTENLTKLPSRHSSDSSKSLSSKGTPNSHSNRSSSGIYTAESLHSSENLSTQPNNYELMSNEQESRENYSSPSVSSSSSISSLSIKHGSHFESKEINAHTVNNHTDSAHASTPNTSMFEKANRLRKSLPGRIRRRNKSLKEDPSKSTWFADLMENDVTQSGRQGNHDPQRPPSEPTNSSRQKITGAVSAYSLDGSLPSQALGSGRDSTPPPPPPPRRRIQPNASEESVFSHASESPGIVPPRNTPSKFTGKKISIAPLSDSTDEPPSGNEFMQRVPSPKIRHESPFSPPLPAKSKPFKATPIPFDDDSASGTSDSTLSSTQSDTTNTITSTPKSSIRGSISDSRLSKPLAYKTGLKKTVSLMTGNRQPPPIPEKKRSYSSSAAPEVNDNGEVVPPRVPARPDRGAGTLPRRIQQAPS